MKAGTVLSGIGIGFSIAAGRMFIHPEGVESPLDLAALFVIGCVVGTVGTYCYRRFKASKAPDY
jgi:hypothetical protein